ncbi:hypothetical protein HMPREF9130_0332 [Peptoniphilus sp. oral taxon 375 str. F0436]|nr:hypothetical protein HMPREF9130_0332 [Peptoniphilus sp. oral taxon 375 str. F0436]
MYWQKKWSEEDKDQSLKDEILVIRSQHKDYGYRRIHLELKNRGQVVNKKKVQRLVQDMGLQVHSYGKKYKKYNSYKGVVGKIKKNRINRRFNTSIPLQKLPQTPQNLNTMKKIRPGNFKQRNSISIPTWTCTTWKSSVTSYPISPMESPCCKV